jgi:hypothetical protein
MERFVHSPLTESQIRLFRICSTDSASPIEIKIQIFETEDYPPYHALSYEWGDPDHTQIVLIDNKTLTVPQNLVHFLLRLVESELDTMFWADAICINQENLPEKSGQVRHMGFIFAKAIHVNAWVWNKDLCEADNSSRAPTLVREALESPLFTSRDLPDFQASKLQIQLHEALVLTLVSPSYWTRRWIIQELVLARNVTLIFGTVSIPLETVNQLFLKVGHINETAPKKAMSALLRDLAQETPSMERDVAKSESILTKGIPKTRRLLHRYSRGVLMRNIIEHSGAAKICQHRILRSHAEQPGTSWTSCLRLYYGWKCGMPHDILYSIQALVYEKAQLKVDYSLSPFLLIDQAVQFVKQVENLDSNSCFLLKRSLVSQMNLDLSSGLEQNLEEGRLHHAITNTFKIVAKQRAVVSRQVNWQDFNKVNWHHLNMNSCINLAYNERYGQDGFSNSTKHHTLTRNAQFWEQQFDLSDNSVFRPRHERLTHKKRSTFEMDEAEDRFYVARQSSKFNSAGICEKDILGIAEFPVRYGDEVWQIPGIQTALIMRKTSAGYKLVSISHIARDTKDDFELFQDPITSKEYVWSCLKLHPSVGRTRVLEIDIPLLMELS